MQLESGGSGSWKLIIDENGHAHVRAVNQEMVNWISQNSSDSFIWTIVPYNYAAGDTIILLRNDNPAKKLIITDIYIQSDTATDFQLHCTDGTDFTPAGTNVEGINLNRSSANPAIATCIADETANTQGNILINDRIAANENHHIELKGAVVLGYNNSLAVDLTTVGTMCYATITGYFEAE